MTVEQTSQTSHAGGRLCTVCHHGEAAKINAALIGGEAARSVAGRYALSDRAVQRHAERHVIEALQAASVRETPEQRALAADSLLEQVRGLAAEVRELVDSAKGRGDDDRQLRAIRELRPTLELLGRVTGELQAGGTVTVNVIQAQLGCSLEDAKAAVAMMADARALEADPQALAEQAVDALDEYRREWPERWERLKRPLEVKLRPADA